MLMFCVSLLCCVQVLRSVSEALDTTPKQLPKRVRNLVDEAQKHSAAAQRLRAAVASGPAARSACVVLKDDSDRDCHFWVDELPAALEGDTKLVRSRAMHLLQTHPDTMHVVTAGSTVACAGSMLDTLGDAEGGKPSPLDARFLMRQVTRHFGGKGGGTTSVTMGRFDGAPPPSATAIAEAFGGIKLSRDSD